MYYTNIHSSSIRLHELLSCNRWDVVFITESPWGVIGTNRKISNRPDFKVYGTTNNPNYQLYQANTNPLDRSYATAYVQKTLLQNHTVQTRPDLIKHNCILPLQIDDSIFYTIYNKPELHNNPIHLLCGLQYSTDQPLFLLGDFNLHSAIWDDKYEGTNEDRVTLKFINWYTDNKLTLLNRPNQPTWFNKRLNLLLTSVVDLFFVNSAVSDLLLQDWKVDYDNHSGTDHFPITWTYGGKPMLSPDPVITFSIDPEKKEQWQDAFVTHLSEYSPEARETTSETLELYANLLIESCIRANETTFQPKKSPMNPRHNTWWDTHLTTAKTHILRIRALYRNNSIPATEYRTEENHYHKEIQRTKNTFYSKRIENRNPKDIWTFVK